MGTEISDIHSPSNAFHQWHSAHAGKGRTDISRNNIKKMGYINDQASELRAMLEAANADKEAVEAIVKFCMDKIWESYKNGTKVDKKDVKIADRAVKRYQKKR